MRRVLGSRATFTLGQFGGHATGALKAGDVLHLGAVTCLPTPRCLPTAERRRTDPRLERSASSTARMARPTSSATRTSRRCSPRNYEVHFNSARTGVRLIGPKPKWARSRRRRGGAASFQHPRQCLCGRRHRFHRRHADHPRARRPEPRRLRLPGRGRARRTVEDGPAQARRHRPLSSPLPAADDPVAGPAVIVRSAALGSAIVGTQR